MKDVTRILQRIEQGQAQGTKELFPLVYDELRRILIESARRKNALKRGGDRERLELDDAMLEDVHSADPSVTIALEEAVSDLETEDAQAAQLLKLLLYAGLSVTEAGKMMGVFTATAHRNWSFIRLWFKAHWAVPAT